MNKNRFKFTKILGYSVKFAVILNNLLLRISIIKDFAVDRTHCIKFLGATVSLGTKELISAKFLWGNVLLEGKLQIYAKNSHFEILKSALYMKSVRICDESVVFQQEKLCTNHKKKNNTYSLFYI